MGLTRSGAADHAGSPAPRPAPPAPGAGAITRRSVVLGLLLLAVHTVWLTYEEVALLHLGEPTVFTLVQTVVGILFLLLILNAGLRALRPALALTPAEIMVVFVMTSLGATISASKFLDYLFPTMLWPSRFPAQSGGADAAAALPAIFAPRTPALVGAFFSGTRDFWGFFRPDVLNPWLLPMLFWGAFILVMMLTMICLGSILRRPWIEEERLPFPIVELPMMMAKANDIRTLMGNRLLALGFAVSAVVLSTNYLATLYPSVPGVRLAVTDISAGALVAPPWSSISPLLTVWWPYAIGLCYLIPLDVSFSCIFFFVLIRALVAGATALGWRDPGSAHDLNQFPYFGNLAEGAFLGMFGVILWNARRFLGGVIAAIRRRDRIPGDETEAIPYRFALAGALIGFALLVAAAIAAGMRPHVALLAFTLYLIAIVVMTRMYAQVALPLFCMAFFSFTSWTTSFTGTQGLTRAESANLTALYWTDRTYEQIPMGHHLDAFAAGDRLRISKRRLLGIMLISIVVASALGMVTLLQIFYDRGASSARVSGDHTWFAGMAWSRFAGWIDSPRPVDIATLGRTGLSAVVVVLLTHARAVWTGFPLHPIGYLFASSFALEWGMWNVILATMIIKALVVRWGGLRLYRQSVPLFLGLAMGDAVTQFAWGIGLSIAGARGPTPY